MADLVIEKINEVYLKVKTEPSIEHELRDKFTFEVPNRKFMPQYRSKYWDGYVHLFNMKTKRIYVGLLDKVVAFCPNLIYDNPTSSRTSSLRFILGIFLKNSNASETVKFKISIEVKDSNTKKLCKH